MSWGCLCEDKGWCSKTGSLCDPGQKECVLEGKVRFIDQEEKNDNK